RDGSKLVYHRLPWQEPFAPYLLEVLYEDDDMNYNLSPRMFFQVALNKPSGLQVLPKGLFQQRTVLAQLQLKGWKMTSSCCSKRKEVQSHPVPVHRLGRGTSGLFLYLQFNPTQKFCTVQDVICIEQCLFIGSLHLIYAPSIIRKASNEQNDPLYGIGGHPKFVEPQSTDMDSSFAYDGRRKRRSGTRAMEGSPATRLPEANSLPDGFVESSGADTACPPSPAPVADDPPHAALDSDRPAATNPGGGSRGETLGDPSLPAPTVVDASSVAIAGAAEALETLSLDAAAEPARALGEHGPAGAAIDAEESLKQSFAVEQARPPSAQKQKESGELKRKVVKRSKLEKDRELFELAQQYHKVVAERDAAIAIKEKLESLCREFQRQNKMLKEECRRVSTDGQNMRMELLRSKLKDLADQYNVTQQKYAHQLKEKMLELELANLKLQQHQEKAAQEHTQMQLYAEQVSQLMTTEKNLRLQLASDGERFQQFQDALSKSNEVFETYKQEMEKMISVIKNLKKENEFLKGKCENSDIALVKLIEERELTKKQIEKLKNQKEKLESLCRSLQAERKQGPSTSIPEAPSSQEDVAVTSQDS
ncbi:RNA pseudouridine synthase 5, partial [Dichanthelium oligosanthes]